MGTKPTSTAKVAAAPGGRVTTVAAEDRAVRALRADLASGRWMERNQHITGLDAADFSGRLFLA
jgi:hypothetical protein